MGRKNQRGVTEISYVRRPACAPRDGKKVTETKRRQFVKFELRFIRCRDSAGESDGVLLVGQVKAWNPLAGDVSEPWRTIGCANDRSLGF